MSTTGKMKEKREMRHVERKYIVFYLRLFDGMSTKVLGHVIDISEKGIMMISDSPIEVNETYRLRMSLPAQMKESNEVILAATSRWCKRDPNPDFYLSGFYLADLDPETKKVIYSLIREFGYSEQQ